ncbi:MAG: hypothetical protein ACON35_06740 [Candidatus Marinamargulisbacteria bacterium]
MSNIMDYDKNEPKHTPIILSIVITIVIILIMTFGLVIYFKGSLKVQESQNEINTSNAFELKELRKWEKDYLKQEKDDKINIDDAIYITTRRYNN